MTKTTNNKIATRTLGYRCPNCNRKLKVAAGMNVAVQVVTRKCGGCKIWWQIVIEPRVGNGFAFDTGTFAEMENK